MTSTDADDARDAIAALRASHDRLRAVVAPLTPEQLRQGAYPSEWTVAQTLSHLGSGAEIGALGFDAGVKGEPAPEMDAFRAVWAVWDAKGPDEQAADALKSDETLVEKYESLTADQLVETKFTIWSGPTDVTGLVASRLSEQAVHVWDVEVVFDPAATILPEAVGIVLDGAARLVGFTGKPASPARVHVTVTGPDREYALVLGEKAALEPWDGGESTAELSLPAEAFLRLLYGRLDADHTPAVTATGIDLDTLRATFPGF
jgi:uncharacterized protein (TIGR03083 family)